MPARGTEHLLVIGTLGVRHLPDRPGLGSSLICLDSELSAAHGLSRHNVVVPLSADAIDEEWVACAEQIHRRDPISRIAVLGETHQPRGAAIAAALGLPYHSVATVTVIRDKSLMRDRLARAGVERTTEVLTEEFLSGPQFSVEAFSEAGEHCVVAVIRKHSGPVSSAELGHAVPAEPGDDARQAIAGHVQRVLDALGVRDGPTHTELVLTPAGPRVMETRLRVGGGGIPDLVRGITGIDLAEYAWRQILGESVLDDLRERLSEPPREAHAESVKSPCSATECTASEL